MKFTQFLGYVFEGAFKAGFLHNKLKEDEYRKFLDHFYFKLIEEYEKRYQEQEGYSIFTFLQQALQRMPYNPFNVPEEIKLRGLDLNESNAPVVYTKLTFNLGYTGGFFYGQKHKEVELKKIVLGEESYDIVWENADLLFLDRDTLYVIDFKATGITGIVKNIAAKRHNPDENLYIPFLNYGTSIHLSLGHPCLEDFIEALLKQKDIILQLKEILVELKGIFQLSIYSADFICREKSQVKQVELSLFYPFQESFTGRFTIKDRERLESYVEQLREVYDALKDKTPQIAELINPHEMRQDRLREKYGSMLANLTAEIERRRGRSVLIEAGNIEEVRRDVSARVQEHHNRNESGILMLAHSAGSGKTSSVRNTILKSPDKQITLYLSSRVSIVEKEFTAVKKALGGKTNIPREWIFKSEDAIGFFVESELGNESHMEHKGTAFESKEARKRGNLSRGVEEIKKACHTGFRQIWCFTTLQSIVNIWGRSTASHLRNLLTPSVVDNYRLNIILDEFFGHNNGLSAIKEVATLAKEFNQRGGIVKVYLFDANVYSPELLEGLLQEFDRYGVIPDGLVLCNPREELTTRYMDLPMYMYAKHGYPASGLVVHEEFIFAKNLREDGIERIAQYINQTFTDGEVSSAFLFLQDKDALVGLAKHLNKSGKSTLIATASSRKTQGEISKGNEDIILGTSTVSRGLDFNRPHKPVDRIYVVVSPWHVEENLVEVIQAISRARGDEETEGRVKHIHLIYIIEEPKDYQIESMVHFLNNEDRKLISLAYKSEILEDILSLADMVLWIIKTFLKSGNEPVLIPVPAQHDSSMARNKISDVEGILTSLWDIAVMEKESHASWKIHRLREIIRDSIHIYTEDIGRDFSKIEYYHPYCLIKNAMVHMWFSGEQKKHARMLCKELEKVLNSHNKKLYKEVMHFLDTTAPAHSYVIPVLVPAYAIVFTEQVLCEEDSVIRFTMAKNIGRGSAQVLMGSTRPFTKCSSDGKSVKEYACIPLGESYPYMEVLSGRFIRFPAEFVKTFLEVRHGNYWQKR